MQDADAGKHDIASSVLSSAASYEDALRASLMTSISAESGERAEDAEVRKHLQKRGEQAIVLYFASRMEAVPICAFTQLCVVLIQ